MAGRRSRFRVLAVPAVTLVAVMLVALVGRSIGRTPAAVLVLGDSIAGSSFLGAGRPVTGGWPARLDALLGDRADVRNAAAGGVTLALDGLHEDIPSVRTTFTAAVRAAPPADVALVAAGRNDLHHASDETLQAAVDDIARQAAALGVRVYFLTLLPTSTAYGSRALTEAQRLRFNAYLRSRYPRSLVDADRAVDPQSTGLLPAASDGGDGFHLSPEGSMRIAAAAAAALTGGGAVPPVALGAVDVLRVTGDTVSLEGWALDESAPTAPATLRVTVDGAAVPATVTATRRADVDAYVHFGAGPDHGFAARVPVPAGRHLVCAAAMGPGSVPFGLGNGCGEVTTVVAPPCARISDWERFLLVPGDWSGGFRWTMTLSCRDGTTFTVSDRSDGAGPPAVAPRQVDGTTLIVTRVHVRADLARPGDMPWFEYTYAGRSYWIRVDLAGVAGYGRYASITESWNAPGHVAWVDGLQLP